MKDSLTLTLPLHLDNRNSGRGHSHWKSTNERREIEGMLRQLPHHPVRTPARIHLTRVLGPKQSLFDYDSLLRGTAKELIDSLVAVGIIPDDGPKHITEVTASQDATRRKDGPATIITITTLEEA